MDLIYVITWIVLSVQSAPCPTAALYSELGVTSNNTMSCAVMHVKTVKEPHEKTFTCRDSAKAFVKRLRDHRPDSFSYLGDRVESIKIDSLKVK